MPSLLTLSYAESRRCCGRHARGTCRGMSVLLWSSRGPFAAWWQPMQRVDTPLQPPCFVQCDALLAAQGSAAACPSLGAALLLPEERASLQAYLGAGGWCSLQLALYWSCGAGLAVLDAKLCAHLPRAASLRCSVLVPCFAAAPGSDAAEVLLCVLEKLEPTLGSSIAAASPGIVSAAFALKVHMNEQRMAPAA